MEDSSHSDEGEEEEGEEEEEEEEGEAEPATKKLKIKRQVKKDSGHLAKLLKVEQ